MTNVEDPMAFIHELGSLHDVEIREIALDPTNKTLSFVSNDLNAAFTDIDNNKKSINNFLKFCSVEDVIISVNIRELIIISRLSVSKAYRTNFACHIDLAIGGFSKLGGSIQFNFGSLQTGIY